MTASPLKVLLLAAYLPPEVRPQAILLGKLLRHFPRRNLDVSLLTAAVEGDSEGVDLVRYRTRGRILTSAMARLFPGNSWLQTRVIHGDALSCVERLQSDRRFDVVMSFANPYSMNVLGAQVSRKYKIPFIAHYSDPFVDNPYHDYSAKIQGGRILAEQRVLSQAAAVVFVNDRLKEFVLDRISGEVVQNAVVIPHSFDASLYPSAERVHHEGRILIRHIGALYGPRNGASFLDALALLRQSDPAVFKKIKAEFIGPNLYGMDGTFEEAVRERSLEETVLVRPILPYLESLGEMVQADLLLNIDAGAGPPIFLTSKLIDYLGASRPILCLTPPGSPTETVCRRVGAAVANVGFPEDIASTIRQFDADGGTQRLDAGHVADFSIEKISQKWAELFRTLV